MYKVFFNNNVVFLTDEFKENFLKHEGLFYKFNNNREELFDLLNLFFYLKYIKSLYIIHEDLEVLREVFKSIFKITYAAGGLIKNADEKYLFIYRRNKWDLPKGKIDDNETPEITALREVKEECGLKNIKITNPLISTYHTYIQNETFVLKKTYWFEMLLENEEIPIPQVEEDITDIKWFPINELEIVTNNTFGTIIDLLKYKGLIN